MEFELQLLSDLRRYMTAFQRFVIVVVYSLLVVVLTASATRLAGYILHRSRDPHHAAAASRDLDSDYVTPARPATVSVSAQTRNFTAFNMRFSETKV